MTDTTEARQALLDARESVDRAIRILNGERVDPPDVERPDPEGEVLCDWWGPGDETPSSEWLGLGDGEPTAITRKIEIGRPCDLILDVEPGPWQEGETPNPRHPLIQIMPPSQKWREVILWHFALADGRVGVKTGESKPQYLAEGYGARITFDTGLRSPTFTSIMDVDAWTYLRGDPLPPHVHVQLGATGEDESTVIPWGWAYRLRRVWRD